VNCRFVTIIRYAVLLFFSLWFFAWELFFRTLTPLLALSVFMAAKPKAARDLYDTLIEFTEKYFSIADPIEEKTE